MSTGIKITYDDLRFYATTTQLILMANQQNVDLSSVKLKSSKTKKKIADLLWKKLTGECK
jgi:hypothetical protein